MFAYHDHAHLSQDLIAVICGHDQSMLSTFAVLEDLLPDSTREDGPMT